PAGREARPRALRLHRACVLPATSRGGARRLPALRQPGLTRQMISPDDTPDQPPAGAASKDSESTGLPWPASWAGVYALVVGCFVTYVVLLVALKRAFS